MVLAEWGNGQMLWSFIWFFLFFIWVWLIIVVFADLFRSDDLGGLAKALWAIGIIVMPYLGVFIYLIARGGSMQRRAIAHQQASQAAFKSYVQEVAPPVSTTEELAKLGELKASGVLSDEEFAQAKAKLLT